MLRLRGQSKVLLSLLCMMVVMMRLSGAHMHFCLDGSEPPASLHLDDADLHHLDEHGHVDDTAASHSDVDVSLIVDAVLKKAATSLDLLVLLVSFALVLGLISAVRLAPVYSEFLPPIRAHLRPLLRGPPL